MFHFLVCGVRDGSGHLVSIVSHWRHAASCKLETLSTELLTFDPQTPQTHTPQPCALRALVLSLFLKRILQAVQVYVDVNPHELKKIDDQNETFLDSVS